MCFILRVRHVQKSVLCIQQSVVKQMSCLTMLFVRKIRRGERRKFFCLPLEKGAEGCKPVQSIQKKGSIMVGQLFRQFMDKDQQMFQSASCGYHGEAGIGDTQHLFSPLIYRSPQAAELAAYICQVRFFFCLSKPV